MPLAIVANNDTEQLATFSIAVLKINCRIPKKNEQNTEMRGIVYCLYIERTVN